MTSFISAQLHKIIDIGQKDAPDATFQACQILATLPVTSGFKERIIEIIETTNPSHIKQRVEEAAKTHLSPTFQLTPRPLLYIVAKNRGYEPSELERRITTAVVCNRTIHFWGDHHNLPQAVPFSQDLIKLATLKRLFLYSEGVAANHTSQGTLKGLEEASIHTFTHHVRDYCCSDRPHQREEHQKALLVSIFGNMINLGSQTVIPQVSTPQTFTGNTKDAFTLYQDLFLFIKNIKPRMQTENKDALLKYFAFLQQLGAAPAKYLTPTAKPDLHTLHKEITGFSNPESWRLLCADFLKASFDRIEDKSVFSPNLLQVLQTIFTDPLAPLSPPNQRILSNELLTLRDKIFAKNILDTLPTIPPNMEIDCHTGSDHTRGVLNELNTLTQGQVSL